MLHSSLQCPEQPLPLALHQSAPGNSHLLELVLSGAADLGGEALSQLLQAAGVLQLDLGLPAEELLQVLQQLQARLRLLLQAFELLHQLRSDLCRHRRGEEQKTSATDTGQEGSPPLCQSKEHSSAGAPSKPWVISGLNKATGSASQERAEQCHRPASH